MIFTVVGAEKEINYKYISSVELIVKQSKLDGEFVKVFGFLSRDIWGGFYLFTNETNDLYSDLASAIPFYPNKKHRNVFFNYVSKNCLNRYVRIKGQVQATDKKRSNYGYLLITDGIWDLSLKGEPGCHFNFLSEIRAKKLGFEQ